MTDEELRGRLRTATDWAEPPEEAGRLAAPQRLAFGLACTEHLEPSLALQARAHPTSVASATLSATELRACLTGLWQWLASGQGPMPDCVTAAHVEAAYDGDSNGLAFLVPDAVAALWHARLAYHEPHHGLQPAHEVLDAVYHLVHQAMGPRSDAPLSVREEASRWVEREEQAAAHVLVRLATAAQAEAAAALAAGADPAELREPAQQVGGRIAEWTAQLL